MLSNVNTEKEDQEMKVSIRKINIRAFHPLPVSLARLPVSSLLPRVQMQ